MTYGLFSRDGGNCSTWNNLVFGKKNAVRMDGVGRWAARSETVFLRSHGRGMFHVEQLVDEVDGWVP